jgi:hypothetical protein
MGRIIIILILFLIVFLFKITNHLGQLTMADENPSNQVKLYDSDYIFAKTSRYSSHKNNYDVPDEKQS